MSLSDRWRRSLDELQRQGRFRKLSLPRGLDFSSNDYLGYGKLSHCHPSADSSTSGQASRLLRGHHERWDDVEQMLAAWHGAESALVFNSGYVANEGLLSAILEPDDFLASDQFNHASIIDGVRLTKAERFVFQHNDLCHLDKALRKAATRPGGERFVVTEAIFGMEGDRAPLTDMVELAEKHGAHLIVDEAHSTGCFGARGSGLVDQLGLRSPVLATVHTGGKALGVTGAYIACGKLLRDVLINRSRQLIFTTALPPVVAEWWLEMLPRVASDEDGRQALHRNATRFRDTLRAGGMEPLGRDYIVPVILGDDAQTVAAAEKLRMAGFDVRAIRPPTVPPGTSRLRISIHADHDAITLVELARAICER